MKQQVFVFDAVLILSSATAVQLVQNWISFLSKAAVCGLGILLVPVIGTTADVCLR